MVVVVVVVVVALVLVLVLVPVAYLLWFGCRWKKKNILAINTFEMEDNLVHHYVDETTAEFDWHDSTGTGAAAVLLLGEKFRLVVC